MPETRWWWVRHGPTHEKAFVGWRDVPADLSDTDRLARLDRFLPGSALVLSSDLSRASATAHAIAGNRTILPDEPAFREINLGDWDGLHFSEVSKSHPELSRAFWESPGALKAPGGESWDGLSARVSARTDELTRDNNGADIIAVAHMGVILCQLQRALGVSAAEVLAHRIDPLSVTCLAFDGAWRADMINHDP